MHEVDALEAGISGIRLARDRGFIALLARTAVPVALQALMSSSRTLIDAVLVSHLGTDEVAAIGYGGRVIFVAMLATMGMADGGAVVIARLWGSGNSAKARQATGVTAVISLLIAVCAFFACFVWAEPIVRLATDNDAVVALGTDYVRTVAGMIMPFAVICALTSGLRSVGDARVAVAFAAIGVVMHIALAYGLVFGHWGLPSLGVTGTAWGTLISTYAECLLLMAYVFGKRHVVAFQLRDCVDGFRNRVFANIRSVGVPVSLSSASWALGVLAYNVLVGRAGTQELAALSVISPLESIAIALFIGVSTAAAVLVGNSLGLGDAERTWGLSKALMVWTALVALLSGVLLFSARFWIATLYPGVDAATMGVAEDTAVVLGLVFVFRAMNITVQNGLLRAGGDTVFILKVDLSTQWLVAVPLTALVALVWHLPFPLIFFAINCEEIARFFISGHRLIGRGWMRILAA